MRSDKITKGINAAPQRALLHALGLTDEEIEAAFCLKKIFDFISISNNKVIIKIEYLHLLEKIYFPFRFKAKK